MVPLRAVSEMLDKQVHQGDGTVGNDDQNGCEGAGNAVGTLLRELIDLYGDQQELRCNQQNNCGNSRNASYKGCYKS